MWTLMLISFCFLCVLCPSFGTQPVVFLEPGDTQQFQSTYAQNLYIFCHRGQPKRVAYIWRSVTLHIDHSSNKYMQYEGETPQAVRLVYESKKYSWLPTIFSWKQKKVSLYTFNQSCIGLETGEKFSVRLHVAHVDYWKVLLLICGVFFHVFGGKLSQNAIFHYTMGVLVGVLASFLLLIYFISRLFNRKPVMYGVILSGWSIGVYIMDLLYEHFRVVCANYFTYLLWYVITMSLISFSVCYIWGPVQSERTQNLLRWALKTIGLVFVYYSSQMQEAAVTLTVFLFIGSNMPKSWISKSRTFWHKTFPKKIRPLSNDEYYEQGVRETAKALEGLREYCSSPQCNQWKTALKLKDVRRFASFIEGSSHITDEESMQYEMTMHTSDLSDDSNSDDPEISDDNLVSEDSSTAAEM